MQIEETTIEVTPENMPHLVVPTNPLAGFFGNRNENEVKDTTGLLLHKYEQIAIRAHNGVSFSPERRGRSYIKDYSEELAADLVKVAELGGDVQRYQDKYEQLFSSWMHSKGNCISSMITGGSRFPVARANKANDRERKHGETFFDWRKKALTAMEKAQRKAEQADVDPIAAEQLLVAQRSADLEKMKAANKILRSKKLSEQDKIDQMLIHFGWKEATTKKMLVGDFHGVGYAAYQLTNCRNRLKHSELRLAELQRRATTEAKEVEREDGITVVENAAENRLQVFFPGKPEAEVRTKLKQNGFRWSPTNGCWQSYLNSNAKSKLNYILDQLTPKG